MKQSLGMMIGCIVGVWASSCTSGDDAMAVPEASDKVIAWQPVHDGQTRVQLFEPNNTTFYDGKVGGGEFTVDAYYDGTALRYIGDGRVWYRGNEEVEKKTGVKDWINMDESGASTDYYWPNVGALNFFAYMPSKKFMEDPKNAGKKTYVTLSGYTDDDGQQFSCDLPATNADDANAIEFIYAYTPNQTFANAVAGSDGVKRTPLKFVHPFSLVCFRLGSGSIRMTVKSITLGNLHLKGTFSTGQTSTADGDIGSWQPTGSAETYKATIDKRIPNEVNYNTVFGGPYVMMPQDLASVSLTLEFQREDMDSESTDVDSGSTGTDSGSTDGTTETKTLESLKTDGIPKWEPGKRYTYTLMHGDNNEEIYFNVLVEDWEYVGHRNEIDVE